MAGVAALLTLPFLFAAAIQAMVRSDLTLLLRSAFGYLPLGLLAVSIAAPLTMLLLAASDQISQLVSSAAGSAEGDFLAKASLGAGALSLASHSPFLAFFVGLLAAAAALVLWCELLIRSAAVYVIVLMLPLFFAALVWPARRVWAIRAVELLVALILSKFAIVAVLALGGAAIGHTTFPSVTDMLAGATLILLAAFSPWALLRLLPLHEMAAGVAAGLRTHPVEQLALAANQADVPRDRPDNLLLDAGADPEPAARTAVQRLEGDGERSREDGAAGGLVQAGTWSAPAPEPRHRPAVPGGAASSQWRPQPATHHRSSARRARTPTGCRTRRPALAATARQRPPADAQHDPAADPASPVEDRLPGMPALWQAEDGAWRTLRLGPDADYRPVNEPGPAPQADDDHQPAAEDRPGEDHDPGLRPRIRTADRCERPAHHLHLRPAGAARAARPAADRPGRGAGRRCAGRDRGARPVAVGRRRAGGDAPVRRRRHGHLRPRGRPDRTGVGAGGGRVPDPAGVRRARFSSAAPGAGVLARGLSRQRRPDLRDPAPSAPDELRGVRIMETEYRERTIGALSERSGRRLTAVLACRVLAFSLLDAEAQERRLARWGLVLSAPAARRSGACSGSSAPRPRRATSSRAGSTRTRPGGPARGAPMMSPTWS